MNLIEVQSLKVIIDKPNDVIVDETIFIKKYFKMFPLKIDPKFGLYKVKLFKSVNKELISTCDTLSIVNDHNFLASKSPEIFSITEINVNIQFSFIIYLIIHFSCNIIIMCLLKSKNDKHNYYF